MDFLAIVAIIAIMGLVIYKRHVFERQVASRGALDSAAMQLRNSIEMTAELMIERMQEQAEQLTFIINEADGRIAAVDERIKKLETLLNQSETVSMDLKQEVQAIKKVVQEQKEAIEQQAQTAVQAVAVKDADMMGQSELNKRIFSMLDNGEDIEYISRVTGVGKGAIALIKQMYKNTDRA